jgi:hypothetical protein
VAEIANWGGLPVRDIPVEGLVRYEAEDGTALFDLPGLPLPDPSVPAPVRFLGTWDAALLVHARRALILPEEHRPKIFNVRMPQSIGTYLVDGAVAGVWKPDGTLEAFEGEPSSDVHEEFARLMAFCA